MKRSVLGTKAQLHRPITLNWRGSVVPAQVFSLGRRGSLTVLPMDPDHRDFPLDRLARVSDERIRCQLTDIDVVRPRMQTFPEKNFLSLAAFLQSMRIVVDGLTFSFVVLDRYPHMNVGVRVLKDDGLSPLELWTVPWEERAERNHLNSQVVFGPLSESHQGNLMSTETHEGLGWMLISMDSVNPQIYITIIQEDMYLIDEMRRQQVISPAHRKRLKVLRLWKHLLMGALEDLAPRLGIPNIVAISLAGKYKHLYDGLFSKRVGYDDKLIYERVPKSALPQKHLEAWSPYWWRAAL